MFLPALPPSPPPRQITELVAVTSLNPHGNKNRQRASLETWKRAGLVTHAVQFPGEIKEIRNTYGGLVDVIHDTPPTEHTSPSINRLIDVSKRLNVTVMVLNADLEIIGAPSRLLNSVHPSKLTVGIRHNYATSPQEYQREPWGLDVFILPPQIAARVDQVPEFRIGRPMWDYWLPWHLGQKGVALNWIAEPFFFHRSHEVNWSQEDWLSGRDTFLFRYKQTVDDWAAFRNQWPHGSRA
jgi:hypothetical protein